MDTPGLTLVPAADTDPALPRDDHDHDHGDGHDRARAEAGTLEAHAAVLAASCALRLSRIARLGGPDPAHHLEELRRLLVRREGRRAGWTRRRQIRHAIDAAGQGRPGAIAVGDRLALVRDLRELDRALGHVTRVGAADARACR